MKNRLYWRFFVLLRKEWSVDIYFLNNSAIPYSAVAITETRQSMIHIENINRLKE